MPRERFSHLRSVRWRIGLGVLPSSPSASIGDLRRVTADTRRRYANLRRRLLIEHHIPKEGDASPDLALDNPLSQNPDSTWGRFFKNAELGKLLDQDLSRLYPEHQGYFHAPLCQAMLKRILLLWCLQHPEYGYRQGMHELLAPLVYVLYADLDYLFQMQKLYDNYFNDEFDGISSVESDMPSNYGIRRVRNWESGIETDKGIHKSSNDNSLDELDPDTRDLFLLSDSYGAEGELGIVLSKRFLEHDAYCMFDNLMNGAQGVVAMASFFSPVVGSSTNLPPVIEASSALYNLLSIVDFSLHNHLVELEVEPQYFALRWLRVLFGREFGLDDLLLIWDELFCFSNSRCLDNDVGCKFKVLGSHRGAFIAALAVSMLLYQRSSLLATETATTCLQRLLNFPQNPDTKKLIEKAKSLQIISLQSNIPSFSSEKNLNKNKLRDSRRYSLPSASALPISSLNVIPDSYWEEKWRVLHKDEELDQKQRNGDASSWGTGKILTDKLSLSRTNSEPYEGKITHARLYDRRQLFDDSSNDTETVEDHAICDGHESPIVSNLDVQKDFPVNLDDERTSNCVADETLVNGNNSLVFSKSTSPLDISSDHENESEKSSVTTSSFLGDKNEETINLEEPSCENLDSQSVQHAEATSLVGDDALPEQVAVPKEWKPAAGVFQWLWKFGRDSNQVNQESQQSAGTGYIKEDGPDSATCEEANNSSGVNKRVETGDKKMMGALKNIGKSMLENIQVIEAFFQQEKGKFDTLDNLSNNILGGKGQNTAISALKELRKISNLLQKM
ncbi:TBC1 domain family member protein [Canna indica]|uniref:TBC1 domain family member protein n=1 Tax=Canna indica TaxID=4628 RepID=A0AAQ3QSI7_9LILI|nr:TBC1 domain family member protein [Canna indica]